MAFGDGYSGLIEQSRGKDLYRRGIHVLEAHRAAGVARDVRCARSREGGAARALTNTPLQALALLNDPAYVEAARALAQRTLAESRPDDKLRIARAFRLATARVPAGKEVRVLRELLQRQRAAFARDGRAALALVSVGESPRDKRVDPSELAAWTMVTSAILNLDETITRQ